jgi:hypothetical protein
MTKGEVRILLPIVIVSILILPHRNTGYPTRRTDILAPRRARRLKSENARDTIVGCHGHLHVRILVLKHLAISPRPVALARTP